MKNIIKCLCFALFLIGCSDAMPQKDKIVGVWKSHDGAIIILKKDNSVNIINYPLSVSNPMIKGEINGKGSWRIYEGNNVFPWVLELSVNTDRYIPELYNNGILIELLITKSGFLGNGDEVTSLFFWKGDPDSDDRYEFKKINRNSKQ